MQTNADSWSLRLKKSLTANASQTTWFVSLRSWKWSFVRTCVIWNPTVSALILINEWVNKEITNVNWIMLLMKDTNSNWRRKNTFFIMQLRWVLFHLQIRSLSKTTTFIIINLEMIAWTRYYHHRYCNRHHSLSYLVFFYISSWVFLVPSTFKQEKSI